MKNITRIIQITDTHLFGGADGQVYNVNTHDSLAAVVKHIQKNVTEFIDAIVVTGDISQDETPASYQRLLDHLAPFSADFYWLPGNHDIPEVMTSVCPRAVVQCAQVNQWQLIMLDSTSRGQVSGKLSNEALNGLDAQLSGTKGQNTVIALHHHPYQSGSEWMDPVSLINAGEFQKVISEHDHVKVVIHGHIHQSFSVLIGAIPCFATPSTCAQFKVNSLDFQIDLSKTAGYRTLELYNDGRVKTFVSRV